jgi:tRNA (guanosine-2'-O-)-methyltransferase
LSEEAIKGADEKIYIPMKGMVQSLNISVSAAIFMYELDRQKGMDGEKNQLEIEERSELEEKWLLGLVQQT